MFNNVLKINRYNVIYTFILFQLFLCFTLDVVLNNDRFLLAAIILDIVIFCSIIIFYNNCAIIGATLICSFSLTYLIENMGMPPVLRYIQDYFIFIMAIKIIMYFINNKSKLYGIYYFIFLFILFSIISCILNPRDIIQFFKTIYFDYLRYFIIAIFIIKVYLPEEKIIKFIKTLWYALLCQIPLVIFQYFWSLNHWVPKSEGDIRQDYLSGIIGGRGTTELGLLVTIALTALFILYLNNKVKLYYFIVSAILLITISILAEVKFILILLPVVFLMVVLKKFTFKSLTVFSLIILMLGIGVTELQEIYPEFNNFFTISKMEKYSNDEYALSGVGRTDSFIVANEFITDKYPNTLFGYGAGNADRISKGYKFSAFNVSQFMSESGYLGVICIYGLFIYMIYVSAWLMKHGGNKFEKMLGQFGVISMIIIIIATFYNRSMVKINFAVFSWMLIGLIYKYYILCKERLRKKDRESYLWE